MEGISFCCTTIGKECGCKPWALSKCETVIHLLPGIGWITSAASWWYSDVQVTRKERDYEVEASVDDVALNAHLFPSDGAHLEEERSRVNNRRVIALTHTLANVLFAAIWAMTWTGKPTGEP